MLRKSALLILLLITGLVVAACGQQTTTEPATPDTQQPPAVQPTPITPEAPIGEATPAAPVTEATPATPGEAPNGELTLETPPAVPNAAAAQQYSGVTLTYYGDSVGLGGEMDRILARRFTEDTGILINIVAKPQDATENYATYQRFFQAQSPDIDVMMLDVIWPAAFAPHLVDLGPALNDMAQQHYETIVENNTVDGRLIAMPWFADFGMLYYRTDLIEKYGFAGPPATWDELEEQARTIMEGERAEGNANFTGFVWQGSAYEGLTCNALEWIYTHGGGVFLENGEITINNENAIRALDRARGWVGDISPPGVTGYLEEDARNVFQGGNAAFMRNWPYAYAAGSQDDSPIQGLFDVAPLPVEPGQESAGTVGGWQLGVSAYSRNPEAATEFVRYMTSPEVQTWRAVVGTFVPTIPAVASDPQVIEAMPFLEALQDVVRVTRPSAAAGENYNQASAAIFQGTNQILLGQPAGQIVPQIEQQLQRAVR